MKTTCIILALFAVTFTGEVNAQSTSGPGTILIPLEKAFGNAGLMKAIYLQVPADFVQADRKVYQARIRHDHHTYIIYGKRELWILFFTMDPARSVSHPKALPRS